MSDTVEFLRKTEMFAAVPESVLAEMTGLMKPVRLKAGETLFREGDLGDAVYLVVAGTLSVEKDGVQVVTRKPGELVGEMALLDNTPRSSDVFAGSDVDLLRLDRDDFLRIFAQSRELSSNIFRMLTGKLRQHTTDHVQKVKGQTLEYGSQSPALLVKLAPGDLFAGRFTIEAKCGEGGMGIVFKATDTILGKPVALKILTSINSDQMLERFKREVILARKVIHPNACRIFDIGECGGIHYVSMEFLEGETLAHRLGCAGRLSLTEALPILLQVLSALAEIHNAGIIHRDLKPQNIMITPGRACIMDFGIAFSPEEDLRITQTGNLLGTPYYMAPEQIRGERIDRRADLYSVGVILYEMFTGALPFRGSTFVSVLSAHLSSAPPDPSTLVPELDPRLRDLLMRALAKDPDQRFDSAGDMMQSLLNL